MNAPGEDWRDRPAAQGPAGVSGRIKTLAEDFQVTELPLVEPEGTGEHLWLWVRKRDANTDWVARQLASLAGVPPRAVSYAGRKDRRALTWQWFSLHLPGRPLPDLDPLPDGVVIERAVWHGRKLRRGTLVGNRFRIQVRGLEGESAGLAARLQTLATQGFPNYFGGQRFGRDGANLQRALHHRTRRSRRRPDELWVSAVRALLFNRVLAQRVRAGSWNQALPGECLRLAGSHSQFVVEVPDAAIQARLDSGDLHPSGPLWGHGAALSGGVAQDFEAAALAPLADWQAWLEGAGLRQDRRPLRVIPGDLSWSFSAEGLALEFSLPAGSYATVLLAELLCAGDGEPD